MWCATRGIIVVLNVIFVYSGAYSEDKPFVCPDTLQAALGTKVISDIRSRIETGEQRFRPVLDVVPEQLAHTVGETEDLLRRADLLNPVRPKPRVYVDAYYGGEHSKSSLDNYVLPRDEYTICSMQPGRAVFLADGNTNHFALVDAIDFKSHTVTLLDPWASVSFLLPGHNLLGVSARARTGKEGQPYLDLTFGDFLLALQGSIEEFEPEATFAAIEAFYPVLLKDDDYLTWKYSRILTTDSFQMAIFPAIALSQRPDLSRMPKLRLLSQWASDYLLGVPSDFSMSKFGAAPKAGEQPALKKAFIARLDDYARFLPWTSKWLLIQRFKDVSIDRETRLTLVSKFLEAVPSDVDLQIERARCLIELGRNAEATEQLQQADRQWREGVASSIREPSIEEAVALLFARDYNLQSLAVLHWRHARIELLSRIALLAGGQTSPIGHDDALAALQNQYRIGSLLIDFFPEILWTASLSNEAAAESDYVSAVAQLKDDVDRNNHLSLALYRQFMTRQPIDALSSATLKTLSTSALGHQLCRTEKEARLIDGIIRDYKTKLKKFCRDRT